MKFKKNLLFEKIPEALFKDFFNNMSYGVKNIFNAYQNDFDIGKNRDSNYIYGPSQPRTIYIGIKYNLE